MSRSSDIRQHLALVKQIAARIRRRLPPSIETDDLVQAGMMGLDDALRKFEQTSGSSFETYAARRIEGAMLDSLRSDDFLSRDTRDRVTAIRSAVAKLEHLLGRPPRAQEVASALCWKLSELHRYLVDAGAQPKREGEVLPDEELATEDPGITGAAFVRDYDDPELALLWKQRHAALLAAFDALEEADRYVMQSIYDDGMSLQEVATTLDVSQGRVSQIGSEIVARLRKRMRGL